MSRQTKEERWQQKHSFFYRDFGKIQQAVRDVRIQCLSDRRFYSVPGAQWEGPVGDLFENKPRFEFNKTHLAVLRVINEYRNNRITVDFLAKDGSDNDKLADTCAGLYRADEQDSGAQEAYDNAFEEGTSGGMGAIRLRARYEDEFDDDDDRQRIAIEPIYEADTCVFFSLDGKRYDKADSKRCYVLSSMTSDDYMVEWGDDPASWPKSITEAYFDWLLPDIVWIAEVYEVEEKKELVHFYRGIALDDDEDNEIEVSDQELKDNPDKESELAATGFQKVREKRRSTRRIRKWIMNGARILSDEGYIAGSHIPVVPFYGKRWFVDSVERCQGHVRLARDAQVLDNMLKSWLAEMAARFDVEKPILTPEQIAGHAQMWADDTIKKYPYLLINPILDTNGQQIVSGPVAFTKAPNMPPAMAALAQLAGTALEDMLGNQQAGEQMKPNQSGIAIDLIQQRLDMQVFIYIDNFCKTMKRLGEVWLSMAKDIFVEESRRMKSLGPNNETGSVELMKPMIGENGEQYMENDLSSAKFDVAVDVGPSSSSRRAATVRNLTAMKQGTQDPQILTILDSLIMMNMEGEGISDVRSYFRKKLVQMGVVKPTPQEEEELAQAAANQPPDPNAVFLQAAAQKEAALAQKAGTDMELAQAKAQQARAETAATLAGIGQAQAEHALEVATRLGEQALARDQMDQQTQQMSQPLSQ